VGKLANFSQWLKANSAAALFREDRE